MNIDIYSKLKSPSPTPPNEICICMDKPPIKLMNALNFNPIFCVKCGYEVQPGDLGLGEGLVESIASWNSAYRSIYVLWLDSQSYEDWAKKELQDIDSAINKRGLEVAKKLCRVRSCYYWLFQNSDDPDVPALKTCPLCNASLKRLETKTEELVCESCKIITAK